MGAPCERHRSIPLPAGPGGSSKILALAFWNTFSIKASPKELRTLDWIPQGGRMMSLQRWLGAHLQHPHAVVPLWAGLLPSPADPAPGKQPAAFEWHGQVQVQEDLPRTIGNGLSSLWDLLHRGALRVQSS